MKKAAVKVPAPEETSRTSDPLRSTEPRNAGHDVGSVPANGGTGATSPRKPNLEPAHRATAAASVSSAPILCVYGPTGSGKTAWIESIIPLLKSEGLRIATVKSCHHDPDLEPAGKDSARHLSAGAIKTLLLSPSKSAVMENRQVDNLDSIRDLAREPGVDFVIVEGARISEFPKVALLLTQKSWNLPDPFPLLAYAGRPPLSTWKLDWTETHMAAQGINEWLALRKKARGVLGVILAGGRGHRMGGRVKAKLHYQGMTLAQRADALLRCFVEETVIATPRPEECSGLPYEIVRDHPGFEGPLAGLIAALKKSQQGILVMGVDHVGLTPSTLAEILQSGLDSGAAVLADETEIVPTVCYVSKDSLDEILQRAADGDLSLRGALDNAVTIRADRGEEADLDTPEDLAKFGIR